MTMTAWPSGSCVKRRSGTQILPPEPLSERVMGSGRSARGQTFTFRPLNQRQSSSGVPIPSKPAPSVLAALRSPGRVGREKEGQGAQRYVDEKYRLQIEAGDQNSTERRTERGANSGHRPEQPPWRWWSSPSDPSRWYGPW